VVFGDPAVAAFNILGLDAAAVGNHDRDWGSNTLHAQQSAADYAWLLANVRVRAYGATR
jgi:2',3'-cyclic-nucleotide 2'-phosphodiesterase (5'-nucleotidase family)